MLMFRVLFLAVCLVDVSLFANLFDVQANAQVVVPARAEVQSDRWFALKINGKTAGWQHEVTYQFKERIISASASKMSLRRGETVIEMRSEQAFEETLDGKPVQAELSMNTGQIPVKQTMAFMPDGTRDWLLKQGPQVTRKTLPKVDGQWLTPTQADAAIKRAIIEGTADFSLRTLDLSMGTEPSEMKVKAAGRKTVTINGRAVDAFELAGTVSAGANGEMAMTMVVDPQGKLLRSAINLGGMAIEAVWTNAAIARAQLDTPELMASLMVKPEPAIDRPRGIKHAVYELQLPEGVDAVPVQAGQQTVERLEAGRYRLQVHADAKHAEINAVPGAEYSASTAMIGSEDRVIGALVEEALVLFEGSTDQLKASAFRGFVHRHMQAKDLSVGFASASEAARTGQGDCTEHAVLLAAMLRRAQIPARVVTGLLYVEAFAGQSDVFGYHMWTQAYVRESGHGRWVDLDARCCLAAKTSTRRISH